MICTLAILIFLIVKNHINVDQYGDFQKTFPIWRGMSYIILYIWVMGLTTLYFEIHEINYKLLFNLDTVNLPRATFILNCAGLFTTLYLLLFIYYIVDLTKTIDI